MEPGEDAGGLRKRLAGYVVQGLGDMGGGQVVDGQRAGVDMVEISWRIEKGALRLLFWFPRGRRWGIGLLLGHWPRWAERNMFVWDGRRTWLGVGVEGINSQ